MCKFLTVIGPNPFILYISHVYRVTNIFADDKFILLWKKNRLHAVEREVKIFRSRFDVDKLFLNIKKNTFMEILK